MKKYRLLTAAALLVLPSMLFSAAGYSASRLPEIGVSNHALAQQSCPTGSEQGCFGSGIGVGGNGLIGVIFATADRLRFQQLNNCLQFMQRFQSFGAGPG